MQRLSMGNGIGQRGSRGGAWGLLALLGSWSLACGCGQGVGGSPDARSTGGTDGRDAAPASSDYCDPGAYTNDPWACCGSSGSLDADNWSGTYGRLQPVDLGTPCILAIPISPPDPTNVVVYLNKRLVPHSQTDGWMYGPTTATLVFAGTYCDLLTADPSGSIVQLFCGCCLRPPICIP